MLRILFVDDNPHDRDLVRDALVNEHGGFELIEAASRAQFEARLAEGNYDLVLSDFNILGFEGLQVIDMVRAQHPGVPVVIVTGTGSEGIAVEALKRGAADYVLKTPKHIRHLPYTLQTVLEKVRLEKDRKRAEEALRESEARHRAILRTAMDGFWRVGRQGRLLEVNETYCRMSGYSEQELLALSISDLEAGETPADTAVHMQKITAQGEDRFESRHRRKDGSSFAVEISVQYKPADGGQRVAFLRDITERKQTEDAQRRNEASLEAAQQRARLGSWELDLRSGRRSWSKELFRIYHRDPALGEPLPDDFFAMVHPEDLASIRDAHKLAECADQPLSLEFRTNPAHGPILYLDASIHSVRDARGKCVRLAGTVLDITERKQAEEALRKSEARYRSLFENMLDGYAYCRMLFEHNQPQDFIYLDVNSAFEKLTGLKNVVGRKVTEVIPGLRESHPELFEIYGRVALTGQPERFELYLEPLAAWLTISVYSIEKGCFVAVFENVTDRKRAEDALRESEASYRTLIESASDGIFIADAQGRYVDVNALGCRLLGYAREELLALSVPDVVATKETARVAPELAALKVGEVVCSEWQFRRKDGTLFLGEVSGTILPDGRLLGILRDITERKQAEEALRAQNMELQILRETSQTILASRNIQNMAASILEKALAVSLCDVGVIRLLDRTSRTLDPIASHGYRNPKNLQQHRRHLQDGTTGKLLRIFARKETVVSERVQDEPGLRIFKREGVQSIILIPVIAEHDLLGALQLGSRTPRKFDPHLINLLETLGSNFGIAVQKSRLLEETLTSQAQLRALSRRLVKTQESDRHYLARELHDEIGSLLTGLKLTLGGSADSGTDQIDAKTAAAHAIIDDALAKTRSLSHSLRPPMLDDLGLLPALSWHVKEFTARTNVQVNFQHHDLQGRFPEEVEIAAYRIVQEALTNIARHAQVHEATVMLWADQSGIGIEISDQGAGFDPTATLANASGVGLAGIRERVHSLGGSLTITSAPGTGTSVTVELPLATGEKTVRSDITNSEKR